MSSKKVALITGGVAGMGLAVAQALVDIGWRAILLDFNEEAGAHVAYAMGECAEFRKVDVTQYNQQLAAFEWVFEAYGRVDFVFANAGIAGNSDFYDVPNTWPPTAPSLVVEEVCLRGVIHTSHLAMQYMRRNHPPGGVIVMTASGK
ncbi:Fc.00g056940.m01.CDS01 [Cosmosporella sp. VM-42]